MACNGETISIHQVNINGVNSKKNELSLLCEACKNDEGHLILINDTLNDSQLILFCHIIFMFAYIVLYVRIYVRT